MLGKIDKNVPATWFLLILFAVFAVQIVLQVNHFLVPDSDFFDYAEKANSLRNMEWPDHFKRPPLYPMLIAFISTMMPGDHAELYAAETLGVLSALLALWLLWRITRRYARSSAPWVVWIWAFHVSTLRMALKPKPEIVLTVLILWAFERYLRGDRRAYLIAFLATLVRYEGILAIAAFFVADFFFGRDKKRSLLLAIVSSLFIVMWTFFQGSGEPGSNYGDYFSGYSLNFHFVYMFLTELFGFLPVSWFKVWVLLGALLFVAGFLALWRRDARSTLALIIYLVSFVALHVVWPFSGSDYMVMAAWVALIFLVHGVAQLCWWGREQLRHSRLSQKCRQARKTCLALAIGVLSATVYVLIVTRSPYPQYQPSWVWMLAYVAPLFFFHWPRFRVKSLATFFMAVSVMIFLAFHINSRTRNELFELYYAKAEFRLVGEWFEKNYTAGNRLLVSQPNIVAYYTGLDPQDAFFRLTDAPQLPPQELHPWLKQQNISHVAWLSYNLMASQHTAWSEWVNKNRRLETIAFLGVGETLPGFTLLESISAGPRYAYIYRVDKLNRTE